MNATAKNRLYLTTILLSGITASLQAQTVTTPKTALVQSPAQTILQAARSYTDMVSVSESVPLSATPELYPNPCSGTLLLRQSSGTSQVSSYHMLDLSGKTVSVGNVAQTAAGPAIDIPAHLAYATYIVVLSGPKQEHISTQRIIINTK